VWPEFVRVDGLTLLRGYDLEAAVAGWREAGYGDESVEAVLNQVNIYDIIHDGESGSLAALEALAALLGEAWAARLATAYPSKRFVVRVTGESDGSYGPSATFWETRASGTS
jgi:hypothetical protein